MIYLYYILFLFTCQLPVRSLEVSEIFYSRDLYIIANSDHNLYSSLSFHYSNYFYILYKYYCLKFRINFLCFRWHFKIIFLIKWTILLSYWYASKILTSLISLLHMSIKHLYNLEPLIKYVLTN